MFTVRALVIMAIIGRVAGDILLLLLLLVTMAPAASAEHLVEEAELGGYGGREGE